MERGLCAFAILILVDIMGFIRDYAQKRVEQNMIKKMEESAKTSGSKEVLDFIEKEKEKILKGESPKGLTDEIPK